MSDYLHITSINIGIQNGQPLTERFSKLISADLFSDGKSIYKNQIICFQEASVGLGKYPNYQTIMNSSSKIYGEKGSQLRIVFDNTNLKLVGVVDVDTRFQIAHFKLNEKHFVVINCHIPQKGKANEKENIEILNYFVRYCLDRNITLFIAGDFNRSYKEVLCSCFNFNKNLSFAHGGEITTTSGKSIDHILFSNDSVLHSFQVDRNCTTPTLRAQINHFGIRAKFQIKSKNGNFRFDTEILKKFYENSIDEYMEQLYKYQEKIKNNITHQFNNNQSKNKINKKKYSNFKDNKELISNVIDVFTISNGYWSEKIFYERYLKGHCALITFKRFIRGETKTSKSTPFLVDYLIEKDNAF